MFNFKPTIFVWISLIGITLPTELSAQCVACSYRGVSIVTNGNFTAGNTGFSSQYLYNSNLVPEGNYYVGVNATTYHGSFIGHDHTTGAGKFMIINGSPTPGKKVWCQTVTVLPNTNYDFSTWVSSVHPSSPALLQFEINGVQCGSVFQAPSTVNTWQEFFYTWNSGASVSATICIENMSTIASGNDFGLDDISFSPCLPYVVTNQANAGSDKSGCSSISTTIGGSSAISNITYSWSPALHLNSSSIAQPTVTYSNTSDTTVNLSYVLTIDSLGLGCITSDTVIVTIYPTIRPALGTDVQVCNTSVPLSTAITNDSLLWSNNATTSSITVNQSGAYTVTAYKWGCNGKDTVNVLIDTLPVFSLTDTIKMCTGDDTVLTSPFTGLWNTGANANSIVVNSSGTYYQTVTNGTCTYRDTTIVTVYTYPLVNLGSDNLTCNGTAVNLNAGQIGTWQDNSVASTFTVASSGNYWITVSNGPCLSTDTVEVVIKNVLPISLPTSVAACETNPVTLSFPYNGSPQILWSTGATTPTITTNTSGIYWVLLTDSTCTATDTIDVQISSVPVLNLPDTVKICQGESATLSTPATAGFTFSWNTGSTSNSISTGTAGTYVITVTNGTCSIADSTQVIVIDVPVATLPTTTTICETDSLTLTGSIVPGYTNAWSTGASTSAITISEAGAYSLIVTNDICSDTAVASLMVDSLPTLVLVPSVKICQGESVTLSTPATAGFTFSWNTGSTSNSITTGTADTYVVTVTNGTCSIADSTQVIVVDVPVATLPAITAICETDSLTLTGSVIPGYTNAWSNGASTSAITISGAGTYSLIVINDICSDTAVATLVVDSLPTLVLVPSVKICQGESATLSTPATAGFTFNWNTGSTSNSITTGTASTYVVTVTNGTCSIADSTQVIVVDVPVATLPAITTICETDSLTVTGSVIPGYTNAWSNGASTSSVTINSAGTYSLIVTNDICSDTAVATLVVDSLPTLALVPSVKICQGESVTLSTPATVGFAFSWNTGATSNSITTGTAGTYVVTVTNGTCYIADSTQVIVVDVPVATLPAITTICETDSLTLTGSVVPGYINTWVLAPSTGSVTGASTSAITISEAGTYSLIVTNDICSDTAVATLLVDSLPTLALLPSAKICQGESVTLSTPATAGFTFSWNTGTTSNSISTGTAGTYVVTVTNGTCSIADSTQVIVVDVPVATLPAITTICETDSLTLTGSVIPGYINAWSNGASTSAITISEAGTYSLIVTNDICSDTAVATLVVDSLPISTLIPDLRFCENSAGLLTATSTPGTTILWSTGANTPTLAVNQAGIYRVLLSKGQCTLLDSVVVITDSIPVIYLPDSVKICAATDTIIHLQTQAYFQTVWSNGTIGTDITVSQPGNYTATVTNNTCSTSKSFLLANIEVPEVSLPALSQVCENDSMVLRSNANSNFKHLWSTGETTTFIYVSDSGLYQLTVTNDICADTAVAKIRQNILPVSTLPDSITLCENSQATLTATTSPDASITWSTGASTSSISVSAAGNYGVTLVNGKCIVKDTARLVVDALPALNLPQNIKICEGLDTSIAVQLQPGYACAWNNGDTSSSITISTSGAYSVTIINGECMVRDTVQLLTVAVPVVSLPPLVTICENESFTLQGSSLSGYVNQWSTGSAASSITIAEAGNYELKVINDICSDTSSTLLRLDTIPQTLLPDAVVFCEDTSTILTATGNNMLNILWSTGATTPAITVNTPGLYTVKLVNGMCSITDSILAKVDTVPQLSLPPSLKICQGDSISIQVNLSPGFNYQWSTGSNANEIAISTPGLYFVGVQNGTCSATDSTRLDTVEVPKPNLPSSTTICETDSMTLVGLTTPGFVNTWMQVSSTSSDTTGTGSDTTGTSSDTISNALQLTVKNIGTYRLVVSNDICFGQSEAILLVDSVPNSILADSVVFCENSFGKLSITSTPQHTVFWNTGDSTASISVNQPGQYIATLINGTCSVTDSALAVVDSIPVFNLPDSVVFCEGLSSQVNIEGKNNWVYAWSNGDTTASSILTQSENREVLVTSGTCFKRDSVLALAIAYPAPNLPTKLTICKTDSVLLNPETDINYDYTWSTGEKTASVWVKKSGNYSVSVANRQCVATASTQLATDSVPTSIMADSVQFCETSPVKLIATTFTGHKIEWSTGDTTKSITPQNTGWYFVNLKNGKCSTSDSAWVHIDLLPTVSLPATEKICQGDSIELVPTTTNVVSFAWNTGENTASIFAKNPDNYLVTVKNGLCQAETSVSLSVLEIPTVVLPDTLIICETDSILATAESKISFSHVWNTGLTTQSHWLKQSGIYKLIVSNDICSASDSVRLITHQQPVSSLPDSVRFCETGSMQLTATNSPFTSINWDDSTFVNNKYMTKEGQNLVLVQNGLCSFADSVWVTIDRVPEVQLPDSILLCQGADSTISYLPKPGEKTSWSNGSTELSQTIGTTQNLVILITNESCSQKDTTNFTVLPYPQKQLSSTYAICETDSTLLASNYNPNFNYLWNTGEKTSSVWVKNAGTYSVIITNKICSTTDSAALKVDTLPLLIQPLNFSFCEGDTVLVDLGAQPGYRYNWNPDTTSSINISTPGKYNYTVTNGQCVKAGEVIANMDTRPTFSLEDAEICQGDSLVITLSPEDETGYSWSDEFTTPSRNISTAGLYILKAVRGTCSTLDSLTLLVNPLPAVNIPNPQAACMGDTLVFTTVQNEDYTYSWTNDQNMVLSNDNQLRVTENESSNMMNQYTLRVNTSKGCSFMGVTAASFYTHPTVNLGEDIKLCADSVLLTPVGNYLRSRWIDGDTNSNLWVKQSGTWLVTVFNEYCQQSDTIRVNLLKVPNAKLPADTILCPNEYLMLRIPEMGTWSDSSVAKVLAVSKPGTYIVTVDNGYCKASDEIKVSYMELPFFEIDDVTMCEGKEYALPNFPVNYTLEWVLGNVNDGVITHGGEYALNLSNRCGSYTTEFTVKVEDCSRTLYFPSAFSPDQDGINDVFVIESTGYQDLDLMIFDRWGELIYREKSKRPAWDGTYQGRFVKTDMYEVKVLGEYKLSPNGALLVEEVIGKVTLLR